MNERPALLAWLSAHWALVLLVLLAVLVLAGIGFGVFYWLRKRKAAAARPSKAAPPAIDKRRLAGARRRFLSRLPFRYRATVRDFPAVVVLGPSGSGKTALIDAEVDWKRQQNQFLPSDTEDELLQIFLGPDCVVYEVAGPLLEDGSPAAREALRRLWKEAFGRNAGIVAIVLDARWLSETPPDEQRRVTQLLRGKINTIAEITRKPVETRLVLTHLDLEEGFADFARLLRDNGLPLDLSLPSPGEEARMVEGLRGLEQYLALGLTTLGAGAFERLESFFFRATQMLEGVGRFVAALWEGGTLSLPPNLTRLYLTSTGARASSSLLLPKDVARALSSESLYLRKHLLRCAAIFVVACLPGIAAYANFAHALGNLRAQNAKVRAAVAELGAQHLDVAGDAIKERAHAAKVAYEDEWRAKRLWPPLEWSFVEQRHRERETLAGNIRDAYLLPLINRCRAQCERCPSETGTQSCAKPSGPSTFAQAALCRERACRPEHLLYLLGVAYSSREDELGAFILHSLTQRQSWVLPTEARKHSASPTAPDPKDSRGWEKIVGLDDSVTEDYIVASDQPWGGSAKALWPFVGLTQETEMGPFRDFAAAMAAYPVHGAPQDKLDAIDASRVRLQKLVRESVPFFSARYILDLLNASQAEANVNDLPGIDASIDALEWMRANQKKLEELFSLEQLAYSQLRATRAMQGAELLTRSGGLYPASDFDESIRLEVLGQTYEVRPAELSQELLDGEVARYQKDNAPDGACGGDTLTGLRAELDTKVKPLVGEFATRIASARLSQAEAALRREYVLRTVSGFSERCRCALFGAFADDDLAGKSETQSDLDARLTELEQPGSDLADTLREAADLASAPGLDSEYFRALRETLAPFQPVVALMAQDKTGASPQLTKYIAMVALLHSELKGRVKPKTPETALSKLLSPIARLSLPMLRGDPDSALAAVDAWLDENNLVGALRTPFRAPFDDVRRIGRDELGKAVAAAWSREEAPIEKLRKEYPFDRTAVKEVDPAALEILRPKDGRFWQFASSVLGPLGASRESGWAVQGAAAEVVPKGALDILARLDHLTQVLFTDDGKRRPLALQVEPLQLPARDGDRYVTMSYLRCGRTAAFGFNQTPVFRDFPVSWWDQDTASVGVELRAGGAAKEYRSCAAPRSAWSCFRVLEAGYQAGTVAWQAPPKGAQAEALQPCAGAAASDATAIGFALQGGAPWAAFRWNQ
ncbi:MAG TPA: hypothetical protein VGH20_06450 [Myxococcales bacterium]|jgi:type VI secretion system protein ImpL